MWQTGDWKIVAAAFLGIVAIAWIASAVGGKSAVVPAVFFSPLVAMAGYRLWERFKTPGPPRRGPR